MKQSIETTFRTEMVARLGARAEVLCARVGRFQRLSGPLARVGDTVTPTSRGDQSSQNTCEESGLGASPARWLREMQRLGCALSGSLCTRKRATSTRENEEKLAWK